MTHGYDSNKSLSKCGLQAEINGLLPINSAAPPPVLVWLNTAACFKHRTPSSVGTSVKLDFRLSLNRYNIFFIQCASLYIGCFRKNLDSGFGKIMTIKKIGL